MFIINETDTAKRPSNLVKTSRHTVIQPGLVYNLTVSAVHTDHLVLIIISPVPLHKVENSLKQLLPQALCDFCLPPPQEAEDERSQAGGCNTELRLLGGPREAAQELDRSFRP